MDYNTIYKKVETHVSNLFERSNDPKLVYHNLQHTEKVVSRIKEIASHYNLIENDMLVLFVAAWFHDTGYLIGEPLGHEDKSAQLMRDYMKDYSTDEDLIKNIEECILATKGGAKPV